jgi:hypothetical protein
MDLVVLKDMHPKILGRKGSNFKGNELVSMKPKRQEQPFCEG